MEGKGGGKELGMGGGLPPGINAGISQPSLPELFGGGGGAERLMTDGSLRKTEKVNIAQEHLSPF